jgi:hypothetical protein
MRHLVIFVKAPRLGAVKTRLGRSIGPWQAMRFYRRTCSATIRELGEGPWKTWLAITPDADVRSPFWPKGVARRRQGPGDLGQRMARPFRELSGPVVLVGSDIPSLRAHHIAEAFRVLGQCGAVFGPAADGGFYLVGFRKPPRQNPFRGIAWSRPDTLAMTRQAIAPMGVRLLETLEDVDDAPSYRRAIANLP